MRLLLALILLEFLLSPITTAAPVPASNQTGMPHAGTGQPSGGKPTRFLPMPAQGCCGGVDGASEPGEGIPVYYTTREGLAKAKETGPLFVGEDFVPTTYRGRVVGLTNKTVTIKPGGSVQTNEVSFHPDKTVKEERVYIQDNNQPPRLFVFGDQLLPRPNGACPVQHGHRIADLQMGDVITIGCSRFRGVDHCTRIEIYRRPGGKVPPAVGDDKLSVQNRWDTRRNAEQAREETAVAAIGRLGLRLPR
jgi:hypothetical protein